MRFCGGELLYPLDYFDDVVDGGFGDDAVAEVEDVAGAAVGEREDFFDAGFDDGFGSEEGDGVEVSLHGTGVAGGADAFVEGDAPVEA